MMFDDNFVETMFLVESFFHGKTVYLTEHGCFSADRINAKPFSSRKVAERHMQRLPLFNQTCYGADAELAKYCHVEGY